MHVIQWVKNTLLNIENNPLDVANFLGYEEHIKLTVPELWQQIIKSKPINYSGVNALCTNLKHKNKEFGTWNSKSTSKPGIYDKWNLVLIKKQREGNRI